MFARLLAPVLLCATLFAAACQGDDWPQFRGPDGQGHSQAVGVALTWSETENITWRTPIHGMGWSSPSVAGNQIWVTTALEDGKDLRAIALDRTSGAILHDIEVFQVAEPAAVHANNSHASPTPYIEGDRVYVHFGTNGTACLSTDGKIVWKTQELKYKHGHGPGGSPVVYKDLLIINCDGTDVQYVVALDKANGQIRWKRNRQHTSEDRRTGKLEVPMAYCTPLLLELAGQTQLITLGSDAVVAHEPATGNELWWFTYSGYSNVSRPVYGKGLLFFATGFGMPMFYAVRVPGSGDLTKTNRQWVAIKGAVVPLDVSPLLVADELYTISDSGIAVCYDAASGKQLKQKRLGAKFWASPVYADGRIYCVDEQAMTTVLKPGKDLEVLASNKLDGTAQASPAIVDGTIFLRTDKYMYRIEKK